MGHDIAIDGVSNIRRRGRWRYGLRSLFCLVTALCVLLGAICWQIQVRANRVRALTELGFTVELSKPTGFIGRIKLAAVKLFGREGIYDVTGAFSKNEWPPRANSLYWNISISDIPEIVESKKLLTYATDANLQLLAKFPRLARLDLQGTHVTNDGIKYLSQLPSLTNLILTDTSISDECVTELSKLHGLKHLAVIETELSKQGIRTLQANLAVCIVEYKIMALPGPTMKSFPSTSSGFPDMTLLAPIDTK